MKTDILHALNEARAARQAVVLVKNMKTGEDALVKKGETVPDELPVEMIAKAFQSGKGALSPDEIFFVSPYLPAPKMVIIGAVHISQALAPMATMAGLDPLIIDPRTAFATPERFPDVEVRAEWPQDCLPDIGLDAYTAMAALTHDPKIDDPALTAAFEAGCFYIGALGSRKTHARRVERLTEAGVSTDALARMKAPIGLPVNASTPAEIAVAVLAEIIGELRRPPDDAA
ncbi:MAG: XdhC family protein [Rhodobiaceae bacterium]|nr:XdhC family protein [Rhodobiaceae bacterium]